MLGKSITDLQTKKLSKEIGSQICYHDVEGDTGSQHQTDHTAEREGGD